MPAAMGIAPPGTCLAAVPAHSRGEPTVSPPGPHGRLRDYGNQGTGQAWNMHTLRSAHVRFLKRFANLRQILHSGARARLSGAGSFGKHPVLLGKLSFQLDGTVLFGDRFMADGQVVAVSIWVAKAARLSIGDDVYMNAGASVEVWHDVQIGSNVLMAPFASVIDDDRHEVEPGAARYKGPTTVGNNVWLGRSVAVMPGVTIGDGSVIGANSVVTRDIPPNSFAAGSPARVVRKLDIPHGWVRR